MVYFCDKECDFYAVATHMFYYKMVPINALIIMKYYNMTAWIFGAKL